MYKQRFAFLWSGAVAASIIVGLLLASCFRAPISLQKSPLAIGMNHSATASNPAVKGMRFEKTYVSQSFAEVTHASDMIFVGKVTDISPVQWNQGNGKYWVAESGDSMTPIPLRYITMDLVKPIVPDKLDRSLKITSMTDLVLLDEKNNVTNQEEMEQGLRVGDQVVVFVGQTKIAWRGGLYPAIMLMGTPTRSYFKLGADGLYHGELLKDPLALETLIQKILDERASPSPTSTP